MKKVIAILGLVLISTSVFASLKDRAATLHERAHLCVGASNRLTEIEADTNLDMLYCLTKANIVIKRVPEATVVVRGQFKMRSLSGGIMSMKCNFVYNGAEFRKDNVIQDVICGE
jgi:hypothetical protein